MIELNPLVQWHVVHMIELSVTVLGLGLQSVTSLRGLFSLCFTLFNAFLVCSAQSNVLKYVQVDVFVRAKLFLVRQKTTTDDSRSCW